MFTQVRSQLGASIRMVLVMTVALGVAYPMAVTAFAQIVSENRADGQLIEVDGELVGSRLVGQDFTRPEYLHPRPSAVGYDAAASAGSNLGPTNPDLIDAVAERVRAYRAINHLSDEVEVPVDAVTASGSGLDPHISPANARLQAKRIADARGLDVRVVLALVADHTASRPLGVLGEDGVNVLEFNVALDALARGPVNEPRGPSSARGRLRVYLGAAPGVGKTFKMLEEGRRRLDRGADVVVAVVETHGRSRTERLLDGFEIVPRRTVRYRDTELDDLDLDAVLARRPTVALVDEMAHTNAPGSRHPKRWQDIDELLDAGIDVITTVNIQHLESLNDALTRITGVTQQETVPDDIVRRADQIELVDMAPEALRRRIVHGNVYPRDRIDAALGNYFRVGNLSALRELALLWVADRVSDELTDYRDGHGIGRPWETRERIVVAITGSPAGERLIRRSARLAERSRADLIGVHVLRSDGLGQRGGERISAHRQLVSDLGGAYHEIVGDDPATQLVEFARAENATQLVLGTSRRSRPDELLHGSIINRGIRASPDIDVLVVSHDDDTEVRPRPVKVRNRPVRLPARRRIASWAVAVGGPPLLTAAFVPFREDDGLPGSLPVYMLLVVFAALLGGTGPALVAAVVSFTIGNFALTQPYGTLRITEVSSVLGLGAFLAVGAIVAVVVGRLGRRTAEAERARAQAQALASSAASLAASDDAVNMLLDKLRSTLQLDIVGINEGDAVLAMAGDALLLARQDGEEVALPNDRTLTYAPPIADPDDHLIMRAFTDQLATAMRRNDLAATESRARALADIDQFRTALLRAVSHDLRTPLAAIKAAASSLQQDDVEWPEDARNDFIATIVEEGDRHDRIITNLLDASRLEAGALSVNITPVDPVELIERAVHGSPLKGNTAVVAADGPAVLADRALLDRVLENILRNAAKYAPGTTEVVVEPDRRAGTTRIRVIDHGPGVPAELHDAIFEGFHRLDDSGTGVGLGLAVSQGFVEAMGGLLVAAETPGGGLTMEIVLPNESSPTPEIDRGGEEHDD
jgi:two-component system sensor histidine kinase KdpD